ncbi:aminotransferase class I and II [Xylanimonas cellulosilytica DSM 15894]|uniref:cysteine-S-conjugate beta-lyase n=1 Tax=Xylanimonas cellulosilytica (strain DSM 15894 / JCM 12276 / CECT 5975 / KCTC 9989 / LMG 20990 / NBRC 107835 / XIL07) TaxID=446471 RepID=D1BXC5_XYLCX|nr:aminotransferase class I/II-fold pyridoxal phosphate-dependent enzyme [Xylanimonas cellulosilytica]ACZ29735.1 aminotransferase class I and II [Xylanimonas cellulosilytica DSM 15894]
MPTESELDAITIDQLRAVPSEKWSLFPGLIGAFVAEMDFGTAPAVRRALHDAVDTGMLGYLPGPTVARMQEAYTGFAKRRFGWSVDPERVRPVPDVLAAFEATVRHLTPEGSPVILPTPAYMPFAPLLRDLGRDVLTVPLVREAGRSVHDLDALDAAFAAGGRLLVLVNPHNPTGRVFERGELAAVAAVVEKHGGRVFADEIHAPLVYAGRAHVPYASVSAATAAHTVTATSASKAWNVPGLKAAQLVLTDDDAADVWQRRCIWTEHLTATPGVLASIAAYDDGEDWLDDVIGYLDGNRRIMADHLAEHLPAVGHTPPEGTYLAWLDLTSYGLDRPAAWLREHAGIALTDGRHCGQAGRGHVRLTLATPRPILREILTRLTEALA